MRDGTGSPGNAEGRSISSADAPTGTLADSPADWRENWAGSSARPIVEPVGTPVVVLDVAAIETGSGFAGDVGEHYPAPRATPSLATGEASAAKIESDGTSFGVFSSAREGWRGVTFTLPTGALADCTGLRFTVRSDEPYQGLVVQVREVLDPTAVGPMGPRRTTYATSFDLAGDGAWHQVTLPLFGDGFRGGAFQVARPVEAEKVDQLVFVLPYHRPLVFELGPIFGLRAPSGDVPFAVIYPIVEVADRHLDRGEERVYRSGLPELAKYEELALKAQALNKRRETAAEALALAKAAQAELVAYAADFEAKHAGSRDTYTYRRALGALKNALWLNQVEIDRLAVWPRHADGELIRVSPFVADQYRDYPVEVASIAYWSEGLRVTGLVARPARRGPFPLLLLNHGYGSFSKDHMIQVARAASAGFAVLASDYRGQGESEGRQTRDRDGSAAMARDVVNGARAILGLPFVENTRIGMWGHSMGGGVSWNVLASDYGRQIRAYNQVSSGPPNGLDGALRGHQCLVRLTAGGEEQRLVEVMPRIAESLRELGISVESKVYEGYGHHGMKYQASLREALEFLRRHV